MTPSVFQLHLSQKEIFKDITVWGFNKRAKVMLLTKNHAGVDFLFRSLRNLINNLWQKKTNDCENFVIVPPSIYL